MKKMIEQCKNIEELILSECDLTSLDNFPQLQHLKQLDLSINSLPDEEIKKLAINKQLTILSIADNKITKLDTIKSLQNSLKNLEEL